MTIIVYTEATETTRLRWSVDIFIDKNGLFMRANSAIPQCVYDGMWCDLGDAYHRKQPINIEFDAKELVRQELARAVSMMGTRT